jgi:hypothetical protein
MEYADPQQMSNLSAISLTVIHLSPWTRALTCSTLSTVYEVVRQPKWSSSVTRVLPLWNPSIYWYTFLCIMQFSPYCAEILLWISESFTSSDHKIEWHHVAEQWCSLKVEPTYFHYDCTSFTKHNGYLMTCSMCDVCKTAVWQVTKIVLANCPFWISLVYMNTIIKEWRQKPCGYIATDRHN